MISPAMFQLRLNFNVVLQVFAGFRRKIMNLTLQRIDGVPYNQEREVDRE